MRIAKIFMAAAFVVVLTFSGCLGMAEKNASMQCLPSSQLQPVGVDFADLQSSLKGEQLNNAELIIGIAAARSLSPRFTQIALTTSLQESKLRNLSGGHLDSAGLFQQRPSQDWGTLEQVTTPVYAINKFFDRLVEVKNPGGKSDMDLALAVQIADPGAYKSSGNNFNTWAGVARRLLQSAKVKLGSVVGSDVSALSDGVTPTTSLPDLNCVAEGHMIAPDGFVFPVAVSPEVIKDGVRYNGATWKWRYDVVKNYHHDYLAADIHAPVGSPVVASMSGRVVKAVNPTCEGRGDFDVPRITIVDEDGRYYYYTHLMPGSVVNHVDDRVKAGQQIGRIGPGECAENTGPHVHINVSNGLVGSTNSPADRAKLIDVQPMLVAAFNGQSQSGTGSSSGFKSPLKDFRLSSKYGNRFHPISRGWKFHDGVDMAAPQGTPVYAVADGKVSLAGAAGGYGNMVRISHSGSVESGYGHLSGIATGITSGVVVKQGQLIGYVGSTGASTGNHLHLLMHKDGKTVDPANYLRGLS